MLGYVGLGGFCGLCVVRRGSVGFCCVLWG